MLSVYVVWTDVLPFLQNGVCLNALWTTLKRKSKKGV